jgi:probable HAF family extracellular repeat protein
MNARTIDGGVMPPKAARAAGPALAPGCLRYRVVRVNDRPAAGVLNAAGQVAFSELQDDGSNILKFFDGKNITTIGTLGGRNAFVADLSDTGEVAGYSNFDDSNLFHALRWSRREGLVDLGTVPGSNESLATAINNRGQVVGYGLYEDVSRSSALLWDPRTGVRDLGNLGAPSAQALAINDAGRVAGNSRTVDGVGMAFSWTRAEGMIGLLPPDALGSDARAINASGQIAGNFTSVDGAQLMFLWTPGRAFETIGDVTAFPFALSDTAWIAGVLLATQSAFVWHRDLGIVDIGFLPGGSFSNAYDVNNRGQVVGEAATADAMHAFLWTRTEGLVDLNDRLVNPPPAPLQTARHINNHGVILASTSAGLVLLYPSHGGPLADRYLSRQVSSQ